jgi:FkbM family methyltransferase
VITDSKTLHARTLLGRLVRLPLRLVPSDAEVRILRGPLRGTRWIAGSSSHGCWLGTYEIPVIEEFAARVQSGMVVYDVGANVGLFTLLAAERGARVVAFEPDSRNRVFLERHLAINGRTEAAEIVAAAVGAAAGRCRYRPEHTRLEGRLDPQGPVEVEMVALDHLDRPDPSIVKIDVEGGELDVLAGAQALIRRARPLIFLEVHDGTADGCRGLLEPLGYRLREIGRTRPARFLAEPVA